MPHFPSFVRPGGHLPRAPVDPDRARLNALRHDVAAAGRGEVDLTPPARRLAEQEIARLERVVGEAR